MRYLTDLIRVTEAAAIAASKWVGSGNKEAADLAATEAMRRRFNKMDDFRAKIVIGEGKKDNSYGLFSGEMVGSGSNYEYDISCDPVEGTTPTVNSGPEAISVMAIAEKDCFWTTEEFYALKLAYGPKIAKKTKLNLDQPIEDIVKTAALVLDKNISEMMVCVLNRPRHNDIIKRLRNIGCRIKLISDCDVSGAVATCLDKTCSSKDPGVDLLYNIGGCPEAVISAAAIKCLGGDFQCQVCDPNSWAPTGSILGINDLVKGNCMFVATGITPGSILQGVKYSDKIYTNSCFMRSESGTVRFEETWHGN